MRNESVGGPVYPRTQFWKPTFAAKTDEQLLARAAKRPIGLNREDREHMPRIIIGKGQRLFTSGGKRFKPGSNRDPRVIARDIKIRRERELRAHGTRFSTSLVRVVKAKDRA